MEAQMNTKAKSNSVITHEVQTGDEGTIIRFNVLGAGTVELNLDDCHNDIIQRAAVHGMIQRISDAAAIGRNPETGQSASPQDKLSAMTALVEHYTTGTSEWSRRPQAGEGRSGGLLFRALCQMSEGTRTPEEIREWMAGKTKAQLAALRASERVAAIIATLRPVSIEVDTENLLDELNA
jgi:hypothetical protein